MKQNGSSDLWICLGRIIRPHGVRGALSFKLDNPNSDSLRPGLKVRVETKKGVVSEHTVAAFQAGRILSFVGLDDRDVAETFNQSQLFVKRSDFPNLRDDEIYLNDMIGFDVVDQVGEPIGKVEGFSDNTAQVLLVVRASNGVQGMIPYVQPLITRVDQLSRQIVVDIPQGLFESEKEDA